MPLTRYQERARREVGIFLDKLAAQQSSAHSKYASLEAWEQTGKEFKLFGAYNPRKNGVGKDLPNFCVRVPTGGGKTLLATQILGLIYKSILKDRNGAGLVLWVVPSDQIYKDTLKKLRDRADFHRESLEFAVSRRIEVWEKDEIFRITPNQMRSDLNILLLKLASTNRETKEQLRFFRDSGGNIVQHFPSEDDPKLNKELKERIPNLDMIVNDEVAGEHLVVTSLGNLVRLYAPLKSLKARSIYRSSRLKKVRTTPRWTIMRTWLAWSMSHNLTMQASNGICQTCWQRPKTRFTE